MSSSDKLKITPCVVLLEKLSPTKVNNVEKSQFTPTTLKKRTKRRILNEILNSEESYVHQLEIIRTFFIKPIKERNLLTPSDFQTLFHNFDTIYLVNIKLLEKLRDNKQNVAYAFSQMAPFLKLYSCYASEFKASLELLQNSPKDNPKFAKFVEMQESRPEVQSKLSALLITPIQRVPRYKLLLQSLFDCTSPLEDDFIVLLESLDKVSNAADHINKIIKERENMQRLIELQRCLQNGEPNIITPSRNLIKEGILSKEVPGEFGVKKTYLVLTSDILMFCKMKKKEVGVNSLKCLAIYPLHKCRIVLNDDKTAFTLSCQEEESTFYHCDENVVLEWYKRIQEAIDTFLNDRKTLKKEGSTRRPVKRKDVSEYNEIGLSPGKKLRKKQNLYGSSVDSPKICTISKRKPLETYTENNYLAVREPLFVHLRPAKNGAVETSVGNEQNVFVFGQNHENKGFTFKMGQWFSGVGSSVRRFFGFKQ